MCRNDMKNGGCEECQCAVPLESWLGKTATTSVDVTEQMISDYTVLSGDCGPLHVDDSFARKRGFKKRLMHGAHLTMLASRMLGMQLPGRGGVCHELSIRFHNPAYAGDRLVITVTVEAVHVSVRSLRIAIRIINQDELLIAAGHAYSEVEAP